MFNWMMQEACNKFEIAMPTKEDYKNVAEIFAREKVAALEQPVDDANETASEESDEPTEMDVSEDETWATIEEERLETFRKKCDIPENVVVSNASSKSNEFKTGWQHLTGKERIKARQKEQTAELCARIRKWGQRKWWFSHWDATAAGERAMRKRLKYLKEVLKNDRVFRYGIVSTKLLPSGKYQFSMLVGLREKKNGNTIASMFGIRHIEPIGDHATIEEVRLVINQIKENNVMFEIGVEGLGRYNK